MSFAVSLTRSAPVPAAVIWPALRDLTDALQAGLTIPAARPGRPPREYDAQRGSLSPFELMESSYLFHVTLRRRGTLTARQELLFITLTPHAAETRVHFEFITTPRWMVPGPFLRRHYEQELERLADSVLAGLHLEALALTH